MPHRLHPGYLVTLPLPPSEGVSPGGGMLPPVPLVMEALGNVAVAPGLSAAPLTGQSDLGIQGGEGGGAASAEGSGVGGVLGERTGSRLPSSSDDFLSTTTYTQVVVVR